MVGFLQDQQGSVGSERANIGSVRHDSNRPEHFKKGGTHALTMVEKRFSTIRLKCRYLLELGIANMNSSPIFRSLNLQEAQSMSYPNQAFPDGRELCSAWIHLASCMNVCSFEFVRVAAGGLLDRCLFILAS